MLEDTIERPRWHVHTELSSDRDGSGFNRVLELSVAALRADVFAAVLLEHAYDLADFHQEVASLLRCITVKLRGWPQPPDWSRGRTISSRARGDTTERHGTLQRLLARGAEFFAQDAT